jgi:hypothetical protein
MDFVCLKHVCENGWKFSLYLYIYLYVLNVWHMCAKIMNLWKMNSTWFPLPNPSHCEMQSLWSKPKVGLVASLVPRMTIRVDSNLWSTQPTLFWSHILHWIFVFKKGLEDCKKRFVNLSYFFILSKFTSIIHSTKLKWKSYLKIKWNINLSSLTNRSCVLTKQCSHQIYNNVGQFLVEG